MAAAGGGASEGLLANMSEAEYSGLVPLRTVWRGSSPKEIEHRDRKRRLDLVVVPVFAVWYLLQAYAITAPGAVEAARGDAAAVEAASAAFGGALGAAVKVALAVLAMYILLLHSWAFPAPSETQDAFFVQAYTGRWVYLTRHCLALQAWHQVMSVAAPMLSAELSALTHGISIWIAGLGWFVTVQYMLLVVPSDAFKKDCLIWEKRGVHFKEIGLLVHVCALPIAVLDITVAKGALELKAAVSMLQTMTMVCGYTGLYLCVIVANFKATGRWPYGFLTEFGTDLRKWTAFVAKQICVLSAFTLVSWAIFLCRTA